MAILRVWILQSRTGYISLKSCISAQFDNVGVLDLTWVLFLFSRLLFISRIFEADPLLPFVNPRHGYYLPFRSHFNLFRHILDHVFDLIGF